MLTRLKLKQAFGRLVRRADDRGVFVMLDRQLPTPPAGRLSRRRRDPARRPRRGGMRARPRKTLRALNRIPALRARVRSAALGDVYLTILATSRIKRLTLERRRAASAPSPEARAWSATTPR